MARSIEREVIQAGGWMQWAVRDIERRAEGVLPNPFMDEWDFLTRAVWTTDEAAGAVRQFPALGYIEEMVRERRRHRIFAIEKSRRMLVSWTFCALYLYNVLTRRTQGDYIASRKLETSCELVGRLVGIHERIPASLWKNRPDIVLHAGPTGKGYRRIDVPRTGSFVEAVAEGKDQLRQY